MPRIVSVLFRGESWPVVIDHDGGWEPDTNSHEIEWHFEGLSGPEHDALQITPAEEDAIYCELCQLEPERFPDDVF